MSTLEACLAGFNPDITALVNSLNLQTMNLINLVCQVLCDGAPRGFFSAVESTALNLVADCTLKETMVGIQMLVGNDPRKQLRAWVMVALNEGLLGAYLSIISSNKSASHLGYAENSILLDSLFEPKLEQWFETLLGKIEFQLHLEDLKDLSDDQMVIIAEEKKQGEQIFVGDKVISRSPISEHPLILTSEPQEGLEVAIERPATPSPPLVQEEAQEEELQESKSEIDSTRESPRTPGQILEPVPISPPSPLLSQQHDSLFHSLWTKATSLFAETPSPSPSTSSIMIHSEGAESLLHISDGITCGSLLNQNFTCHQCNKPINFNNSLYCEFSGKFYCRECFGSDSIPNPFRVLNNWDLEPKPVYKALKNRVQSIISNEKFVINELLFGNVPILEDFKNVRIELSHVFAILLVKGEVNNAERIKALLGEHPHLVTETSDVFTIADLIAIHDGALSRDMLTEIIDKYKGI